MDTILDRIIGFFSPRAYADRIAARGRAAVIRDQLRTFQGATKGRRGKNWGDYAEDDPNLPVNMAIRTLRNRSRALYNNNPYARKAINTIALNVVGKGIRPAPQAQSQRQADRIKREWRAWANGTDCDFNGRSHFYALQLQAMRTMALSGECLIVRRRNASKTLPFQLQVLEGDHLDANKNSVDMLSVTSGNQQGGYTVQGVEFDEEGRRVAYWIYDRPPSNSVSKSLNSKRIPAEDVIHLYEETRPGQVRGVPFLAASLLRLRDFDDYEDAQLMRQKVAASFSVFVTQDASPTGLANSSDEVLERIEPGIIERLAPGEQVSFASPPPADGYEEYTRRVLQGIAAGSGASYEAVSGDLSKVNFSSGRMGWLEAWKQAEHWQHNVFIPLFCGRVWDWFNEALQQAGFSRSYIAAEWTPQGRYMIDPAKEIKGITAGIASGLQSWSDAVRQQGSDPETMLEQMKEDARKLEQAGLKFDWTHADDDEEPDDGE